MVDREAKRDVIKLLIVSVDWSKSNIFIQGNFIFKQAEVWNAFYAY